MDVLIQGAKAGQQQAKRPSIADDTIASISRLKALYLLSEGEIKGLANGAASIELEGTPLVDDSGNPNFEGVEWEIRTGTVDQTHIAGMPSASNEVGINTALSSVTPYIRKISNTQLSSVNVNISFPLLKRVKDNGDVVGVTVAYAIDVQTDGMGYVTMINTSLKAKTSGRYQKTHNIKLPEAQTSWQIRVRKITEDGNNETLFNAMQIDSMGEIIDVKLTYPCSALLYLSFDAKTFNNIPKMAVDTLGAYVQVPTNYDPVTRTRTGIWQGEFKLGYTTNPAWHYYNLVTNDRYGLGEKLQPFMIDKWALEYIARICDEPVDDGNGGTEPRFTCNLYQQTSEDAYQVLQHIAGIFRGMSFWDGAQIKVDADTARDCEYVITRANVVNGAFVKTGSAASDRHTIAKVAYSDPANNYETSYAMVRNEQAIAQYGINVLDLSAVGCTSEGQAYRMGLAALLAETNRTQTVSFAMGLDGALPSVASRIDIADMMFTGANTGGRISSVSTNRKVITVDRDNVPVTAGDKLIVNLESGKAQERVITAINGRAITVAIAFDAVAAQNVWAINSDTMPTMPFIVMSVAQNEDGTQYNYTAMQYDPTMYSQIDNGTIIEQRPTLPSNNPYVIDAPESIAVTSRHRVAQGQTVTTLVITWDQVKDAVAYDVEWRKDDGDWIKLSRTGNISAEVDGVYSGNYLARVRAISAFDAISKPTTSTLTAIAGKVGKPPKLLSLKATGILLGMTIDWTFAPGSDDTAYTEIQVASAPGVNVAPLGQFAYKTNTHTINGLQGGLTQYYRARIVDKLGNTSDWTNWISGTTDNNADKIIDLIQGEIDVSALDEALRSEIGKIDINKTILDDLGVDLNAKLAETKASVSVAQADLTTAKANIVTALNKADTALANANTNKINLASVNEAVSKNKTDVDLSISTLTTKDISLTNLYTALKSEYDTNKAKVVLDLKTLTDKDTALASLITTLDSDYKGNKATVSNSLATLTNKDTALTQDVNALKTKTDNSNSEISAIKITVSSNTSSIASTANNLRAEFTVNDNLFSIADCVAGFERNGNIESSTPNHQTMQTLMPITGSKNLTLQVWNVNMLQTGNSNRIAFYTANKTYIESTGSIPNLDGKAYYLRSITPPSNARWIRIGVIVGAADIDTSISVKVEEGPPTAWKASSIDTINNVASIRNESIVRASADTALTNLYTALDSDYKGNKSSVSNRLTTLTNKDIALTDSLSNLSSEVAGNKSSITDMRTTIADNTRSIAATKGELKADFDSIEIGGRNLFSFANAVNAYITKDSGGFTYSTDVHKTDERFISIKPNAPLIFQTWNPDLLNLTNTNRAAFYDASKNYISQIQTTTLNGNSYEIVKTKAPSNAAFIRVGFIISGSVKTKAEVGSIATDWTPAPEDIDNAIGLNKASIIAEAKVASDANKATAAELKTVSAKASSNSAGIQTLNETTAGLNTAIASSTTTLRAEIAAIDIGGTNLVSSQQMQNGYINASTGETVLQDTPNGAQDILTDFIKVKKGEDFIASVYPKNNAKLADINTNIYIHQFNNAKVWVAPNYQAGAVGVVNQFKYKATQDGYIRMSAKGSLQHDYKIERGVYPTGWTPAPEDVTPNQNLFALSDCDAGYESNGSIASSSEKHQTMRTLVPILGGQDMVFQCWNPTKVSTGNSNRIAFYTANKTYISSETTITPNGTPYQKLTRATPANARWARIGFIVGDTGIDSTISFKVEQGFATSWTPSPLDAASSAAAIQETKKVVAGVSAQYTLKLDVGGRISGFGLASSATQSDFAINADKFWIAPPTGTSKGKSPFMVLTSPQTINGTVVPAGTYMQASFIHKAAIDIAQINIASITSLSALSADIGTLTTTDSRGTFTYQGSKIVLRDSSGRLLIEMGLL